MPRREYPVAFVTIVVAAMPRITLDSYVVDVLMPDLVGHDRRPAAFISVVATVTKPARRLMRPWRR
jgi:hypothetical protein